MISKRRLTKASQSAAVPNTKQMGLQQPFKLSETVALPYIDGLAACSTGRGPAAGRLFLTGGPAAVKLCRRRRCVRATTTFVCHVGCSSEHAVAAVGNEVNKRLKCEKFKIHYQYAICSELNLN